MAIDVLFQHFPILTTERLILREITLADVDAIYQLYSDDRVTQYLDIESATTQEEGIELTEFFIKHYEHKNSIRWAISLHDTPTLIGTIGFNYFDHTAKMTEIGYDLMPTYWRNGIMTEALHAVLDYGFHTLNLHRIEANVTVGNQASMQLLESLKFKEEGTLRDRMFIRGAYHSLTYYGLLQNEYAIKGI